MTPYGYRIHDARAEVDVDARARLMMLYAAFVAGETLKNCVALSGIPRSVPTCKRMLANKTYLGTDFYPTLLDEVLFHKVQDELRRRDEARKPRACGRYLKCAAVRREFQLAPEPLHPRSRKPRTPQEMAALQFARIISA